MTVSNFVNPVSLARLVMKDSPHCALSGNGALEFAREQGFKIVDPEELKGDYPNQQVAVGNKDFNAFSEYVYNGEPVKKSRPPQNLPQTYDTVSAVAMDKYGHLACALSTGKNRLVWKVRLVATSYSKLVDNNYCGGCVFVSNCYRIVTNMHLVHKHLNTAPDA